MRKNASRVLNNRHGSLSRLVFSINRGMSQECVLFHKHIAQLAEGNTPLYCLTPLFFKFSPNFPLLFYQLLLFYGENLNPPPLFFRKFRKLKPPLYKRWGFQVCLADKIVHKTEQSFDRVMTWVWCKLSCIIMKSALLRDRGRRSINVNSDSVEDFSIACDNCRL